MNGASTATLPTTSPGGVAGAGGSVPSTSPNRLSTACPPAGSVMPLMALGSVPTGVALPPPVPGVVRPSAVGRALPSTLTVGWVACSSSV